MRRILIPLVLLTLATGLAAAPAPTGASTLLAPGQIETRTPFELQINRLYRAVLDRDPDAGGMAYWYAALNTGTPVTVIADSFASSREFGLRFGVPAGDEGHELFIDQVYRNVLARPADPAGRRYWLGVLAGGGSRAHVVLWFSESVEFGQRTGLVSPPRPAFAADVNPVDARDLGASWRAGCPVPPEDLRLLRLSHLDYTGGVETGELVVHEDHATAIVAVFKRLYEAGYPIQSMRTIDEFDGSDDASMEANNTSAFNCRPAVSSSSWSRHAYGTAVDINPLVNPYVRNATVLPEAGRPFADRSIHHPSVIREGDVVTRAFDAIGWSWGGRWSSARDYQHFSADGR